jgi:hypothetical protein
MPFGRPEVTVAAQPVAANSASASSAIFAFNCVSLFRWLISPCDERLKGGLIEEPSDQKNAPVNLV